MRSTSVPPYLNFNCSLLSNTIDAVFTDAVSNLSCASPPPSLHILKTELEVALVELTATIPSFVTRNLSVDEPPDGVVNILNPVEAPPYYVA